MGSKHGEWFDLVDHLAIHEDVIDSFQWLIKSGDREYSVSNLGGHGSKYIFHQIKFFTINNFFVEIKKKTELSDEKIPRYGLTQAFSYNCFDLKNIPVLQYHSAHSTKFNPMAPWHHKPHRHAYDGKVQRIEVYSFEDRPKDQRNAVYTWEKGKIELSYLDHYEWPFVKEFLDEVSTLK